MALHDRSKTHDLYIGDAGEYVRESVEYAPAARVQGANFGWPCFEGSIPTQFRPPCARVRECRCSSTHVREATAPLSEASVVTRSAAPESRGPYLYADYCLGEVMVLRTQNGRVVLEVLVEVYEPDTTSFGAEARGRVYLTTTQASFVSIPAARGRRRRIRRRRS